MWSCIELFLGLSQPVAILIDMEATSLRFAAAARTLGQVARLEGLVAPSFRSPPRTLGLDRSIRRLRSGVVVSIRLRDRPWITVLVDMIDGVVSANLLEGVDASRLRSLLWEASMADELLDATSVDTYRVA